MELLSTRQAAEHFNVSPRTLESWRVNGDGPSFLKVGRLVRYSKSDIDDWLNCSRHQNTSQTTEQK